MKTKTKSLFRTGFLFWDFRGEKKSSKFQVSCRKLENFFFCKKLNNTSRFDKKKEKGLSLSDFLLDKEVPNLFDLKKKKKKANSLLKRRSFIFISFLQRIQKIAFCLFSNEKYHIWDDLKVMLVPNYFALAKKYDFLKQYKANLFGVFDCFWRK